MGTILLVFIFQYLIFIAYFSFLLVCLFLEKEGNGRRRRETLMCERYLTSLPLTCSKWGPGLQPRHVP